MKAVIEFTGYFRIKTGLEELETELDSKGPSVYDLLKAAERELKDKKFLVLNGENPIEGVLVFFRNERGGLQRIIDMTMPLSDAGGRIIMSNLMGGG